MDRRISDGGVVADGMEVSAVREDIRQPAVDAALHQLRAEQGRSGGASAAKELDRKRESYCYLGGVRSCLDPAYHHCHLLPRLG